VQLVNHRLRQLDPGHEDAALGEGYGNSSRADRELQRRAVARQSGEEGDRRIENIGRKHERRALVIPLGQVGWRPADRGG
jgi:hypothetical protein